jgi:hypothetical protein
MTTILVMESAKKLNFFLAKQGISKYYSPRMILLQRNLNFSNNCKYIFGTFVQGHDKPNPKNYNIARIIDCFYLQYKDNHQGRLKLLHLSTNQIFIRKHIISNLITTSVIEQVSPSSAMQIWLLISIIPMTNLWNWLQMPEFSKLYKKLPSLGKHGSTHMLSQIFSVLQK